MVIDAKQIGAIAAGTSGNGEKMLEAILPTVESIKIDIPATTDYTFTKGENGGLFADVPLGGILMDSCLPKTAQAHFTNAGDKQVNIYWEKAKKKFNKDSAEEQVLIPTIEYGHYVPEGKKLAGIHLTGKNFHIAKNYLWWCSKVAPKNGSKSTDTSYDVITEFPAEVLKNLKDETSVYYIESAHQMFQGCLKLKHLPEWLDFSQATNVNSLLSACSSLEDVPDNFFNFPKATDALSVYSSVVFKKINFDKVNMPLVKSGGMMFNYTYWEEYTGSLKLPGIIDNTNGSALASQCTADSFPKVILENALNIKTFMGSLKSKRHEGISAPLATSAQYLYTNSSVETIDELNLPSVQDYSYAFNLCTALKSLPAIDMTNVTTVKDMFKQCTALTEVRFKNVPATLVPSLTLANLDSTGKATFEIVIENQI